MGLAAVGCDDDAATDSAVTPPPAAGARLSVLFDAQVGPASAFSGFVSVNEPVAGEYLGLGVRATPDSEITPLDPAGLCVPATQERNLSVTLPAPGSRLIVFLGHWQLDSLRPPADPRSCASSPWFQTDETLSIRRAAIMGSETEVMPPSEAPAADLGASGTTATDTDAGTR